MTPEEERLVAVAHALGPLRESCVFVGGSVLCLYVGARPPPRATDDVDIVVKVDSAVDYELRVARVLREHGWSEDPSEGAPRCRWRHANAGVLDAMATSDASFGFSNPWYAEVVRSARVERVGGVELLVASVPSFLATKVQAHLGRGDSDWAASHDLEDLLAVLAADDSVVDAVDAAEPTLRAFLRDTFAGWTTPRSDAVLIGGDPILVGGLPLEVGVGPSLVEEYVRGHFAGTAEGESAANRARARILAIAALP